MSSNIIIYILYIIDNTYIIYIIYLSVTIVSLCHV